MLWKPGTHSGGPCSFFQLHAGPHSFDWMFGKRGTSALCSWRRSCAQQPARPWHRAQTVHMGAAHADHTVRARVGGLPACQGHGVRSQPSTSLWRQGVWGRGHLMAGYVLGWGQVPGR